MKTINRIITYFFILLLATACSNKSEEQKSINYQDLAIEKSAINEKDSLYFEIEKLGKELTLEHNIRGAAVAVIRNGKLEWIQTFGNADFENQIPVTKQTVFNVGSISKLVSAWGFMQLVENNLIGLDDPINNHLSKWRLPNSEYDVSKVTPRRLMSHTAGTSVHGYKGFENKESIPTIVKSLEGEPDNRPVQLINQPGSKWKYSGGGYAIMQLLLEEKTNSDFAEYMKKNVFKPLKMVNTDYKFTDRIMKNAAIPYDDNGNPIKMRYFAAVSAAGLQTTIEDLAKFTELSINKNTDDLNGVLKPETIDLMQKTVPPSSSEGASGLGYQMMNYGMPTIGHTGSNAGWLAQITIHEQTNSGLVFMCNSSNGYPLMIPIYSAWASDVEKKQ